MHAGIITDTNVIGTVVGRREPYTPPSLTPSSRNVRPVTQPPPHEAPSAPRQGDVLSRPARMQIATFQSIASILAVMEDIWGMPLWAPQHRAATTTLRGGDAGERMGPWYERSNIRRHPTVAYGSLFELDTDSKYQLLMGAPGNA